MSITLINPFHLTTADETEFVQSWKETASVFATKSGYLDTKLHRSLDPKARFRFVNVAHWESADAWSEAMKAFPPKEGGTSGLEANPALYMAVAEVSSKLPQPSSDAELRGLETQLAVAYQTHDTGFLQGLLADDYMVTDGPGSTSDKARVLADHQNKRIEVTAFHFDEMKVQTLTGDVALASGQYTWTALYEGHDISGTFRYLRVYVRNEHGWHLKVGQVTPGLNAT